MRRDPLDRTELFEKMPIKKAVILQVIPAVISQMITLFYNLADTYFVGLLNDPAQTASVSISLPLYMLTIVVANLFGVGGASVLAQSLGKKDREGAANVASIAFWCGLIVSVFFAVLAVPLMTPLLKIAGGTEATLALGRKYLMWIAVFGGPPAVLNMLLSNLVRAEGKSGIASFGVSIGCILNIFLDPFFVLPRFLGMGAAGAGLATCLSNLIGTVFFIVYILRSRDTVLSIRPSALQHTRKYIGSIVKIGIPSSLQFLLTVVGAASINKFVSLYTTEAVAAFGIQKKIDQLPLSFSIGVANGLLPMLAYNYSAGNHERRKAAFRFGSGLAVAFAVITLIVYELFAPSLTGLFIGNEETVRLAASFLRIQIIAQPLVAVNYPMIVQFQAMGQVKEALICSILRKGVLDIPLLFLMNTVWPLYGCMCVQPIVDCTALVISLILYRRMNRRLAGNVS